MSAAAGTVLDLVLLDLGLPGCHGLEALEAAKRAFAEVPVVIVSGDESPHIIRAAVEAGAEGYIPKTSQPHCRRAARRPRARRLSAGALLLTLPATPVKAPPSLDAAVQGPGDTPRPAPAAAHPVAVRRGALAAPARRRTREIASHMRGAVLGRGTQLDGLLNISKLDARLVEARLVPVASARSSRPRSWRTGSSGC